jgi:ATP-independent RNA helicase DbpA
MTAPSPPSGTLPPLSGTAPSRASPPSAFADLELPAATLQTLQQLGYLTMTPIQAAALPLALAGRDLIAQARTGSGKTAAFGLALLCRLKPRRGVVQALVLCPTRELAEQVGVTLRRLARANGPVKVLTLCGGTPIRPQRDSLEHGADMVVGTPGRVREHLERGALVLDGLGTLVLDEADRMLEMGFVDDIATIASRCPRVRQTLLFSATYPEGIARLAARFLRDPAQVRLAEAHAPGRIRQRFFEVEEARRLDAVALLLGAYRPTSTLAFCNTRRQCDALVERLRARGVAALALHGDLEQRERDQVLVRFAHRSCSVLVASDVAARGLDVAQIEAVINVDVAHDPDTHIHRIGRTGRADAHGWALTLASAEETARVASIEQALGFAAEWHPLPTGRGELPRPPMRTLQVHGGRKEKIRPADVLGTLTQDLGYTAAQIGKITINERSTYVSVEAGIASEVLERLSRTTMKGRTVKARWMDEVGSTGGSRGRSR